MRDDLHKTAKCPSVWQELFRLGLNAADRQDLQRLRDAAVKALVRDLNVELTSEIKTLLRGLAIEPSLLDAQALLGSYAPRTPLEVLVFAELRAASTQDFLAEAALQRGLMQQSDAYMREFDCRMVEGRVYDRRDVERALREALSDERVREACDKFLKREKVEPQAPPLSIDTPLPIKGRRP